MAAACLARFGVSVRLIDRATVPPDDRSRAAIVQPRTLEAFDNLGIADEAIAAGQFVDSVDLYNPSGRKGGLTFARSGSLDSPYDRLLSLQQDQTERILARLVEALGVVIERGVELTVSHPAARPSWPLLAYCRKDLALYLSPLHRRNLSAGEGGGFRQAAIQNRERRLTTRTVSATDSDDPVLG